MCARSFALAAVALCAWLVPARAGAWQEAHQTGDDMKVRVEPDGTATVEHSIRWRVVRGPLKFIDVRGVDLAAEVEPDVAVASDDGRALTAHLARRNGADATTVRIAPDDLRSLQRGTFTFDVRWRVDLVATHALSRDGSTWRLALSQPPAAEGFDGSQTSIDLPAAPDPPEPIVAETGVFDDGALSTLRRGVDRDVLELARPHVARGESVAWTVRVDGRALSRAAGSRLGSAPSGSPSGAASRARDGCVLSLLAAIGAAFAGLVHRKTRRLALDCPAPESRPRPLVPAPHAVRAVAGGLALALGVWFEMAGSPSAAGIPIALATLLAAWRPRAVRPPARGPGRWLALRPVDAFAARSSRRGDWFDATTTRGRVAALVAGAFVVALGLAIRRVDPEGSWWVAMDAAPLVPLFTTGHVSAAGPVHPRAEAAWLARAYGRLRACAGVRVVPWARIAPDGSVDELRLLVLPRAPMPGLVGIELGLVSSPTPAGAVGMPEVLVRALESTAACGRLAQWAPAARTVTGRRPEERVFLVLPEAPTCRASVDLARRIASAVTDRRAAPAHASWRGGERRADRAPRSAGETSEVSSAAGLGLC